MSTVSGKRGRGGLIAWTASVIGEGRGTKRGVRKRGNWAMEEKNKKRLDFKSNVSSLAGGTECKVKKGLLRRLHWATWDGERSIEDIKNVEETSSPPIWQGTGCARLPSVQLDLLKEGPSGLCKKGGVWSAGE